MSAPHAKSSELIVPNGPNVKCRSAAACMSAFCTAVRILGIAFASPIRLLLRLISCVVRPVLPAFVQVVMVFAMMVLGYLMLRMEIKAMWTETLALPNNTLYYLSTQWCENVG